MKLILKEEELKSIEKWSNKDFLLYFSNRLKAVDGEGLSIPPLAWRAYLARIKGFRLKLRLSNQEYRCFIDSLFTTSFLKNRFVPGFGCIVSEKVYNVYKLSPDLPNEYFIALRNDLYKSETFFKSL